MPDKRKKFVELDRRCEMALRRFRETLGDPLMALAGEPLRRRDISVYRVTSPRFPGGLALKLYHKPTLKATHTHEALTAYADRQTEALCVPRPYGLAIEESALLMEWIDAPNMGELLHRRQGPKARRAAIMRAAHWLRWYHDGVPQKPRRYNSTTALERIGRMAERLRATDPSLPESDPLLARSLALLQRAAKQIPVGVLDQAKLHSDFTPLNLLFDGERTVGIDFTGRKRGPRLDDICRFLIYLDIYRYGLTSAASLRRYGCNARDYRTFMEAYGALNLPPPPAFLYLQFSEAVRRLCSLLLLRASGKERHFLRWLELFRLRRLVRHVGKELARHC